MRVLFAVAGHTLPVWMLLGQLTAAQPPQPLMSAPDDPLATATRLFDARDYENTIAELDRLIPLLDEQRKQDPNTRRVLVRAWELRARSQFLGDDINGARVQISLLLQAFPGHEPAPPATPFTAFFADVKRTLIGEIAFHVVPADAVIELDGIPLATPDAVVAVLAGTHNVKADRPGYQTEQRTVGVEAGTRVDITLGMRRTHAVVTLRTQPSGVEVFINNVSRGTTIGAVPGRTGESSHERSESQLLSVTDLGVGAYTVEFRKACFLPERRRLEVKTLSDITLDPIALTPAVAEVTVESVPPGAAVVLDGTQVGTAPTTLSQVCEGPHTLELRSVTGRFLRRLELRAGQKEHVTGHVRPSFALLPAVGIAEDRGTDYELRLSLERSLAHARAVVFFVPAAADVDRALRDSGLSPGWLAVDSAGEPAGPAAGALATRDRLERGADLARALGVQGVATVNPIEPTREGRVMLAILAGGSGEPDVLELAPGDEGMVAAALERLDASPPRLRRSTGLLVVDVAGVNGALVASVDESATQTGMRPGDVVVAVAGRPVTSVAALDRERDAAPLDQHLLVDVIRGASAPRRVSLTLARVPQVMSLDDQTLPFNVLLVQRRATDAELTDPLERSVNGLHEAIALIRGRNWRDALGVLDRVKLADGPGISQGTVAYLRGLCYEGLGQQSGAEASFREAAQHEGALLTPDGPAIKPLADARLAPSPSGAR